MKSYAVLAAAGIGKRAGLSIPKQLAKIKNKEIILYSLDIFINSKINFESIIIPVPTPDKFDFNWNNFFMEKTAPATFDKIKLIHGGTERQDSIYNSISAINSMIPETEKNNTVVFIHDAARPFVMESELTDLLSLAGKFGASFLCAPPVDTIKEILAPENFDISGATKKHGVNLKTLKRKHLLSAKTPQVFRFDVIYKAFELAIGKGFASTDDISLVENMGIPVIPLISNNFNIKITSALDMEIAKLIIEKFSFNRCK